MPKLSVIIPVYNAERYIDKCIKSIRNQTLDDYDVWLINDGSIDGSLKICEKYTEIDSRIHTMTQKNSGAGMARDLGVMACNGEYIGFVDADDWVDEEMFKYMYEIAKENNADVVRCNTVLHRNGNIKERWNPPQCNVLLDKEEIQKKIIPLYIAPEKEKNYDYRLLRGCVGYIFKRNIAIDNNIHFTKLKSGEDVLFTIQMLLNSDNLYIIKNPFYHYMNCNNSSLSKSASSNNEMQRKIVRNSLTELLKTSLAYDEVKRRWEQEDRRLVYLDIRIAAVYQESLSIFKRISKIKNIVHDPESIKAFSKPIDKSLPKQMYILYTFIKRKHYILLYFAVNAKLRGKI